MSLQTVRRKNRLSDRYRPVKDEENRTDEGTGRKTKRKHNKGEDCMSQQSGNLQSRKDKLRKSAYTLAAAVFCTIGLGYAWFSNGDAPMNFESMTFAAARTGLIMTNYKQTETPSSYSEISLSTAKDCAYEKINGEYGGFDIDGAAPGDAIFFKTTVINRTQDDISISLNLGNIGYSKELEGKIKLVCIGWYSSSDSSTAVLYTGNGVTIAGGSLEENGYLLSSVRLADNITVPGNGGTVGWTNIYWCIQIDGDGVGVECQNAQLKIGQMYMEIEE
jgi:hypothetical protein